MWYRIALGTGLFLLGYALGRRTQHPLSEKQHSGTARIRDALSEQGVEAPESEASDPAETKSQRVKD
jgi:hypothetical protein